MKTVLVIGGYGQFGGRLCQKLSSLAGLTVLVGGRDFAKAASFAQTHGGNLLPCRFDLNGDIEVQLNALEPWLVIDAAGPFQAIFQTGYALPKACIRHGCHYIDLSDSGTFTQGISAFNAQAKAANVTLVSGASSVPALSSAVVDAAKPRFAHFTSIEGGISPGGKIDIGLSISKAVLSYLGKPLKVFRGGQWGYETGYSRVHKQTIALTGEIPLRRWFGLCDAPDMVLFPAHYKGVQTVRFYGSQELWIVHISLCCLARLQKLGLVKNLQNHARVFSRVGTVLGRFASERGGMFIQISGIDEHENPIQQHWNLIASDGDGPFIPILAAFILTQRWLKSEPNSGAHPAVSTISLDEFDDMFSQFSIKSEFEAVKPAPYLFQRVLGSNIAKLPAPVRKGHQVCATKIMSGQVDVARGGNPLMQILASVIGFAKTGVEQPITITMDIKNNTEVWTRTINGKSFRSTLSKGQKEGEIYERFGPLTFKIILRIEDKKLHYDIITAKCLGLPLPKFLRPLSTTHECVKNGRFFFDVEIVLPRLGRLIHYRGWLE